jgi:hypothetical protein
MRRGRAQVVHSYAPGRTFDYERGYCVARVIGISGQALPSDERMQRLREAIARRIRSWSSGTFGLPERPADFDRMFFVQPYKVLFDVWPLVYVCSKCRRAERFATPKDLVEAMANRQGATARRRFEQGDGQSKTLDVVKAFLCVACGAAMEQSRYLLIHESGEADGLAPPPCPKCDGADDAKRRFRSTPSSWNVMLNEMGSERAADFRWSCNKCRGVIGDTVPHGLPANPGLGVKGGRFRLLPHRANAAYHVHTVKAIRIADEHYARYVRTETGAENVWTAYLDGREPTDIAASIGGSVDNPILEKFMQRLAEAKAKGAQGQVALLEEMIKQERDRSEPSVAQAANVLLADIELREELVEYTTLPMAMRVRTLDRLAQDLELNAPGSGIRATRAKERFAALGVERVELVQGFEIFEAAFGFTRGHATGDGVVLRGFNVAAGAISQSFSRQPGSKDVGFPCYLLRAETEALRVTLSPRAIAAWLRQFGVDVPAETASAADLRRWFVERAGRYDRFPVRSGDDSKDNVFTLLHTISHVFVRALSGFSGLRTSSLSEYFFPRCLSFIIYVNKMSFNAGNLRAVCEQAIDRLADALPNDPLFRVCAHDPLCLSEGGACTACLYLADQSCGHANRLLDRSLIFGGKGIRGFWQSRTAQ